MFWRSVVGKLAITILLLVSFVLFILTILLLEFFEGFHIQEAEKRLEQTAEKVSVMVEQHYDIDLMLDTLEFVKDPSSQVVIIKKDGSLLSSESTDQDLIKLHDTWFKTDQDINNVLNENKDFNKQFLLPN